MYVYVYIYIYIYIYIYGHIHDPDQVLPTWPRPSQLHPPPAPITGPKPWQLDLPRFCPNSVSPRPQDPVDEDDYDNDNGDNDNDDAINTSKYTYICMCVGMCVWTCT